MTNLADGGSLTEASGPWVTFVDWTKGRVVESAGTNAGAAVLPFQGWRRFKEAFAPELVSAAVDETREALGRDLVGLADPFGGSGTSALAGQFLGVRPTTIEVNPFLADLIEAKVATYDLDRVGRALGQVVEDARRVRRTSSAPFPGAPPTFVEPGVGGRFLFSIETAARLAAYRDAIARLDELDLRRLFRVILGSVAIPVSNVVVSGKGRRYRSGGASRLGDPGMVERLFVDGVLGALFDLQRYERRRCRDYIVLRGDARVMLAQAGPIDLAVFSPPYPNSFDYTDVYNVELWVLGYLDGPASNRALREATLRSHVQISRPMAAGSSNSPALANTLERLGRARAGLWNARIPEMVGAYFDDMRRVLRLLRRKLREGGRVFMVVGDSRYVGVDVPVATILAEEAPFFGYRVLRTEPFRSMRVSPQQGGRAELSETLVVFGA